MNMQKINELEKNIDNVEKKLVQEKDLMAKDVLQMMIKLVIILLVTLLLVIGSFIGYAVYKDKQFTDFVNSFEAETVDEYIEQDAKDGGNANFLKGDGDIVNGLPKSDN